MVLGGPASGRPSVELPPCPPPWQASYGEAQQQRATEAADAEAHLAQLAAELEAQGQQGAGLQQQLAEARREAAAKEAALAECRALAERREGAVSALQSQIADLDGLVAGMKAQRAQQLAAIDRLRERARGREEEAGQLRCARGRAAVGRALGCKYERAAVAHC